MKGNVKIGKQDVEMVANAFTPVLFQKLFHKDFLMESQKKDINLTLFQELGFVMAQQATDKTTKELVELSLDDYYAWLEEFEAMDIMNAVQDIFALYSGQTAITSKPKKKGQ